jgi:hypothetical protein
MTETRRAGHDISQDNPKPVKNSMQALRICHQTCGQGRFSADAGAQESGLTGNRDASQLSKRSCYGKTVENIYFFEIVTALHP